MVLLGRVQGNLMVKVKASNIKLEDRAARTVATETGLSYAEARRTLLANRWDVAGVIRAMAEKH